MSKFVEAACINSFHSCNKAPPEVTISDTFSAFTICMAGIKGRRKWLEPIDPPHTPNTQVNLVNAAVVPQVTNAPESQPATDTLGSAEVSMLLGNPQQTSQIGTNDGVILDLGSDPCHVQGSQASSLQQMPLDPTVGSPDPSMFDDTDPLNLAFLSAATSHSSSMAGASIQAGPNASAPTSSRVRRLTRQQVLVREAMGFLETTEGDVHTVSSKSTSFLSQPSRPSENWLLRSMRNTGSQDVAANHPIISPRRTRNNYK